MYFSRISNVSSFGTWSYVMTKKAIPFRVTKNRCWFLRHPLFPLLVETSLNFLEGLH